MTAEQLNELSESLSVLSAKSSVLKERDELQALMKENLQAEEVSVSSVILVYFTHDASRIPNHLPEL
jgi:LETM1 and EF-hand domain-containing protein 1